MEELANSAVQAPEQAAPGWYEGVSLEDAELYINANLKSAARSVIAIGYYLKCVKAKELFAEAGFKDIYDYAKDRFGFSTSTTNRYMSRNDKFSINGNSPILDEKYKDFNKSQLQEMLSLDSEQLEKVTPEMSVLQIREMKKPKEIPYVHIPGQIEMLENFPGITPEDVAAASKAREEMAASQPEKRTYTISAEDLLPDPEQQKTEQSIAISQQEPEPAQSERMRKCIHRLDLDFECYLAEEHKHIPGNGKNCDRACCWDCTEHGKGCRLECYSSARRPETLEKSDIGQDCPPNIAGDPGQEQEAGAKEQGAAEMQQEEMDAAKVQQVQIVETQQEPNEIGMPSLEECVLEFHRDHMCKRCRQAADDRDAKTLRQELVTNHGERCSGGSTTYGFCQCDPERIYFQDNMCETFLSLTWTGYVRELFKLLENNECAETEDFVQESGTAVSEPNPSENVIDGEFTEIQEPEETASDQEDQMTELQIAQGELERAKRLLEKGLGCDVDENDIHIRRLKTAVCAWASYVCDLELIEIPPPEPEQPELPLLKNNDQRAAFVDNFETWPLWIETKQTGERYYRYDLEDGTSMVVKVYHAMIFDYKATSLKYEERFTEGYGRHEYYLLQPGKFFWDCDTNRSLLIEKLKEIQKPKKGKDDHEKD